MMDGKLCMWRMLAGALAVLLGLLSMPAEYTLGQPQTDAASLFERMVKNNPEVAANIDSGRVVVYTASSDPESLLGRPGQYVGKVAFVDRRTAAGTSSLEVFRTSADVAARVAKLHQTAAGQPTEFLYTTATALLRLPADLPPEAADAYAAALREAVAATNGG